LVAVRGVLVESVGLLHEVNLVLEQQADGVDEASERPRRERSPAEPEEEDPVAANVLAREELVRPRDAVLGAQAEKPGQQMTAAGQKAPDESPCARRRLRLSSLLELPRADPRQVVLGLRRAFAQQLIQRVHVGGDGPLGAGRDVPRAIHEQHNVLRHGFRLRPG
jgi:hypothetical protein